MDVIFGQLVNVTSNLNKPGKEMSFRYVPNKNLGALVELPYHSLVQLNLKGVSWALTQNSELDKLTQEETKKTNTAFHQFSASSLRAEGESKT